MTAEDRLRNRRLTQFLADRRAVLKGGALGALGLALPGH
jgi:hypothetical protein